MLRADWKRLEAIKGDIQRIGQGSRRTSEAAANDASRVIALALGVRERDYLVLVVAASHSGHSAHTNALYGECITSDLMDAAPR